MNARMRLKELCDKPPYHQDDTSFASEGLLWRATVKVTKGGGEARTFVGDLCSTKKESQEIASERALAQLLVEDDDSLRHLMFAGGQRDQLHNYALLGDAALDFLVTLLGSRKGLSRGEIDTIRQSVLSNRALSKGDQMKVVATTAEARVGHAIMNVGEHLEQVLLDCVEEELRTRILRAVER
jgi:hypothetical protein